MSDIAVPIKEVRVRRPQWTATWTQLRRDKGALVGLVLILLVFFLAGFGPILAPYDVTAQDLIHRFSL